MCGFAGAIQHNRTDEEWRENLTRMAESIKHRGPDDEGLWFDRKNSIGLTHRRLSIIDLSSAGHQPMVSSSGRYIIVYNGEIYNFSEIADELTDFDLNRKSHSDTEVLLESIERWGIRKALERFEGMFAFALLDRMTKELYLCRDRIGEKPLYYGWAGDAFLFGSELKALRKHSAWVGETDLNALNLFLKYTYVPCPYSIYRDIYKLPPGSILKIPLIDFKNRQISPEYYWTLSDAEINGYEHPFCGTDVEAVETLESLLKQSVSQQLMADVPLGAFLSGGVDSSTIVAIMQSLSERPVNTFTIGFEEKKYNEADVAKAVSQHLHTNHTELFASSEIAKDVIPSLPEIWDEPFADSSQIPTYLVSKLTKNHVTVSLSGDGADELFAGYDRYFWLNSYSSILSRFPRPAKQILTSLINLFPSSKWDTIISRVLPGLQSKGISGDRLLKIAELLPSRGDKDLYRRFQSLGRNRDDLLINGFGIKKSLLNSGRPQPVSNDFLSQMQYQDLCNFLPDDILVKVDRSSMAVSLESRAPFLNYKIVEFALSLPNSLKIREKRGKWILRQVLSKYVPEHFFDRPKSGFTVPVKEWLAGPLKEWAYDYINPDKLAIEGIFNSKIVEKKWHEHQSGQRNWSYVLWTILMFQTWNERNR
jgi:asparagine synthase (glutamine-hydrolysing)